MIRTGRPVIERKPTTAFAKDILRWWNKSRLTQVGAARMLGISPRTLQRWISETSLPSTLEVDAVRVRMSAYHPNGNGAGLSRDGNGEGLTLIDLFAGAGGMTVGFVGAGFHPVFAVEQDEAAAAAYDKNFGPHCYHGPIEHIKTYPKAAVVIGGPPCQGFSNLGKRLEYDPRNQLWRYFLKAVESAHPVCFVIENVPPILKSQEYAEIRMEAERLGYQIEGRVLNAADFGVPQTRRRAIIIGSRIGRPMFPSPTHYDPSKGKMMDDGLKPWRTVRDAIGNLPFQPTEKDWHIGRNPTPMSVQRYRCIPEGGNRWDLQRKRLDLTPGCWIRKKSGGTDLFGRLWWDRPAFTIRTEFFKPEKGRYLHPQAHRPITHREAARLQTFPDAFEFVGSRISVAMQIGNAVPPSLAGAIARTLSAEILRKTYAGREAGS